MNHLNYRGAIEPVEYECGAEPDDFIGDYDLDEFGSSPKGASFEEEEESSAKKNEIVIKNENSIKKENANKNEIVIKKEINFDEFILSQDVLEGNWEKNTQTELLIEQEKNIYEKIKKYSENKGIKEENGVITLLALYYIYHKKIDKINELKFVINKAKDYVKKIFNLEYDEIIKEIEAK